MLIHDSLSRWVPALLLGVAGVLTGHRAALHAQDPQFDTAAAPTPVRLTTEYRVNPLGIDVPAPRLAWQSAATARNWRQTAYQLVVATTADLARAGRGDVWDSGKRDSDQSVAIPYAGPALVSGRRYYWSVRVWDADERFSPFAPPRWWEMGLLNPGDWTARWISRTDDEGVADRKGIQWVYVAGRDPLKVPLETAAVFRLSLDLARPPANASLYVAARGDFASFVNGRRVGGKTRSWAAFDHQDITDALVSGPNVVEIRLRTTMPADARPPADRLIPSVVAGLVKISHADGSTDRYPTSARWEGRLDGTASGQPVAVVADLGDTRFPDPGPLPSPASLFRRAFQVARPVASARLYVTALGSYRVEINGRRVGQDVLTPEFTDYRKRVVYQTYDVTDLLTPGDNALGAILGDGWFASPMSWYGHRFFFGPGPTRLLVQLEIRHQDGTRETVVTDESWKTAPSPVRRSEIYAGEVYDARFEQPGWSRPVFAETGWSPVSLAPAPSGVVTAQVAEPVRVTQTVTPKSMSSPRQRVHVFDMGQNMVGWARLSVRGLRGTRVRLRFAEIVSPDGSIYRDNLRNADTEDVYVLRGEGRESFAPLFTFHGFRYVEVTGYPGTPALDAIEGEVVTSITGEPTGRLNTSSALVNRFWQVGLWGQRGNFLSVPTDCPQRDERLGWTGDAGVFWRTGAYNYDIASFTDKWLIDVRDAQTPQGAFTNTAPHVPELGEGAPGWGDAGVIVPWTTWMQYGDTRFILDNWDAMERWMRYIQDANPDFIRRNRVGFNFSDWLAPDYGTSKELVATAYWAMLAGRMSEMARAVGRAEDARRYDALQESIRTVFARTFVKPNGEVETGTQTAYLMTLHMRLAPEALVPTLLNNLVKAIDARKGHLSTGFLGTPILLFTLADHGRTDLAYRLLLTETYPSWGYMLARGATTWWERWNSDSGDPAMNSYNHYAFGSVVAWVYRYVAGIDTAADGPGFKHIVIRPRLDPALTRARGEYDSIFGTIRTDWTSSPRQFNLRVTIPANTSATIHLPRLEGATITEGGQPVKADLDADRAIVRIGSGSYVFEVRR